MWLVGCALIVDLCVMWACADVSGAEDALDVDRSWGAADIAGCEWWLHDGIGRLWFFVLVSRCYVTFCSQAGFVSRWGSSRCEL